MLKIIKKSAYMNENINVLKGKILTDILVDKVREEIVFVTKDGDKYKMHHLQDCCESVCIDDITGELSDLIGREILIAEEKTSTEEISQKRPIGDDSFLWTFYELATDKGYVTIRWYGTSNGYYSESVDFEKI